MPKLDFYADTLSEDANDTFGGRLSAARDLAGLGLESMASGLGVTRRTLRAWESDRAEPVPLQIFALAGMLRVSPMWLMSGIGEGPDDGDEDAKIRDLNAHR